MKLHRLALVLILPLLLSSCFLAPGAFTAGLDLKRDGSFTFTYKGEVIFLDPEEMGGGKKDATAKAWKDSWAECYKEGEPSYNEFADAGMETFDVKDEASNAADAAADAMDDNRRPCTRAELAALKSKFDATEQQRLAREKQEAAQMAAMFGFNPNDETANAKLAATLMRQEGWRSVSYRGKGVFDVDYQIASKIGHDFIFPLFPQGDILVPFVIVRGQDKGSVRVTAPALIGGGLKALAAQAKMLGMPADKDMPQSSRTKGIFTVRTEGEILTNNTENGASTAGGVKTLTWDINPQTEKTPEALIKLR